MPEDKKNLKQTADEEVEDIFSDTEESSSPQPVEAGVTPPSVPSVTQITFKKKKDWKKIIRFVIIVIVILIFGFSNESFFDSSFFDSSFSDSFFDLSSFII